MESPKGSGNSCGYHQQQKSKLIIKRLVFLCVYKRTQMFDWFSFCTTIFYNILINIEYDEIWYSPDGNFASKSCLFVQLVSSPFYYFMVWFARRWHTHTHWIRFSQSLIHLFVWNFFYADPFWVNIYNFSIGHNITFFSLSHHTLSVAENIRNFYVCVCVCMEIPVWICMSHAAATLNYILLWFSRTSEMRRPKRREEERDREKVKHITVADFSHFDFCLFGKVSNKNFSIVIFFSLALICSWINSPTAVIVPRQAVWCLVSGCLGLAHGRGCHTICVRKICIRLHFIQRFRVCRYLHFNGDGWRNKGNKQFRPIQKLTDKQKRIWQLMVKFNQTKCAQFWRINIWLCEA